jgi:hypothetical protein
VWSEAEKFVPPRRRLWPRRNELLRRTDWLQAALLVAAITAALVLLPIALAVGSETYTNQTQAGERQRQARQPATATLVKDAPPVAVGTRGAAVPGVADVLARWTLPDGTERTGDVLAGGGTKAGSPVRIWLDDKGNPAAEPISHEEAAMAGVAIAMGLWVCATAGLCVLYLLARFGLNRCRSAAWEREWARVAADWTRSA